LKKEIYHLIFIGVVLFVIGQNVVTTAFVKKGDGEDGSRTTPVHFIKLFDEAGDPISPSDEKAKPFSVTKTCGKCHTMDPIKHGWHFNSAKAGSKNAGRNGEPWVLTDQASRTQIPISNRGWQGTYTPKEIGLTPWQYLLNFATHMPGGNYGEVPGDEEEDDPDELMRYDVSGKYEINCLTCHSADYRQDQSTAGWHAWDQNYRWIATGASSLAVVTGSAKREDDTFDYQYDDGIKVKYDKNRFTDGKVYFDITRKPTNDRCFFCHSTQDLNNAGPDEFKHDEDVHLALGMQCVDCHSNGRDHMVLRGQVREPGQADVISTASCAGCHMDTGRFGAPKPKHVGLPPQHLDFMTCTSCHSGPLPKLEGSHVKTSRIHMLGLHGPHHVDRDVPSVQTSVFAKNEDGKLGIHKMIWPAFWAKVIDDKIIPIRPAEIHFIDEELFAPVKKHHGAKPLTETKIKEVIGVLEEDLEETVVYIAQGDCYKMVDGALVVEAEHASAKPYLWPIAHNVRGASAALGAKGCTECHAADAPIFFGEVTTTSALVEDRNVSLPMHALSNLDDKSITRFAESFQFRTLMKLTCLAAAVILLMVLVFGVGQLSLFLSRGPQSCTVLGEEKIVVLPKALDKLRKTALLIGGVSFAVLAGTGLKAFFTHVALTDIQLMLHCVSAPVFAVSGAYLALAYSRTGAPCKCVVSLILFWLCIVLTLSVTLSMLLCMFPIFSAQSQLCLYKIHEYTSLVLVVIVILKIWCAQMVAKKNT